MSQAKETKIRYRRPEEIVEVEHHGGYSLVTFGDGRTTRYGKKEFAVEFNLVRGPDPKEPRGYETAILAMVGIISAAISCLLTVLVLNAS